MELLWRACAMGVLSAVAVMVLKPMKGELGLFVRIGGGILILLAALPVLAEVLGEATALFEGTDVDRYVQIMLCAIGLALLTRISADVCRDTGESAVASGVELAGKIAILALCLPMMREIVGYATRILGETELG